MLVTCQHCNTTYNLPDDKAVKGAKLRCTVCKNVFDLTEGVTEEVEALQKPEIEEKQEENTNVSQASSAQSYAAEDNLPVNKEQQNNFSEEEHARAKEAIRKKGLIGNRISKKTSIFIFIFILVLSGTFWGLFSYTSLLDMFKANTMAEQIQSASNLEQKVQLLELRNVRQYSVDNDKIGTLQVIEGRVINGFDTARAMIEVEAILYDAQGAKLLSSKQLAGTSLSLFQLQVLGKEEIVQVLSNTTDINANNGYIPPNGMTPFMIIFFETPLLAQEYSVKVVSAQSPTTTQ